MPGKVVKKDGYGVRWGGKATAKRTTRAKAQAQLNLLRGVEHGGWKPTGKKARKTAYGKALKGRIKRRKKK